MLPLLPLVVDQRARVSGRPAGLLESDVRLVIEIIMSDATAPGWTVK